MAFLEESDNLLTQTPNSPSSPEYSGSPSPSIEGDRGGAFIPQAHAATDYTNRYPTVNGHKLGILTES
ncbi:MAG: hypothetical protein H6767_02590 [Candidatus Peribacteria bacterium]|nr:MAG: hypothetical protein H6767_02590 [Candidatus Peribacteria bacterium]